MPTIGCRRAGDIWAKIIEDDDGRVSFTIKKRRKIDHQFVKTEFLKTDDIPHLRECLDWIDLFLSIRGELRSHIHRFMKKRGLDSPQFLDNEDEPAPCMPGQKQRSVI